MPTGYFEPWEKTRSYTRFTVLFFWNDPKVDIIANAKVSNIPDCGDENCEKCDGKDICINCGKGLKP